MGKKFATIEIGCIEFKDITPSVNCTGLEPVKTAWDYTDIFDAYKRPSEFKIDIWQDWYKWYQEYNESDKNNIFVDSRNCNFFTISGSLVYEGVLYGFHITKFNNLIWEIVNND